MIEALEQGRRSGVLIVNFEHISQLVRVFLLLTLSRWMPTGYENFLTLLCVEIDNKLSFEKMSQHYVRRPTVI